MLDQLKDKRLEELNTNLEGINRKMGNYKAAFGRGVLSGFGYILGAGLAVILIGWFLTVIGVVPALKNTSDEWREAFRATQQSTKDFLPTDSVTPAE